MINKVTLLGYVAEDIEVRAFEGGSKVARLRVETSEQVYIRKTDRTQIHKEWHTVTAWNELANFVDANVQRGALVYVEGALRRREWVNKKGEKQIITEIFAKELRIVSKPQATNITPVKPQTAEEGITPLKEDVDKIPF